MRDVRRVRLNGQAARFLTLLQDYGHVDPVRADELLLLVADVYGDEEEQPVGLDALRRLAAMWLYDAVGTSDDEGALAEDWPLLFS